MSTTGPLRILITALGGQGGGTLMNWIVSAARQQDYRVQATSVPGVAQRTGSTSYYIEIADSSYTGLFNLVPMPARVDIVICSELIEAARVIEAGLVSPDKTTLIASNHRVYATAEKIALTDGRFDVESVEAAARQMSRYSVLLDLQQIASDHNTYISATLFGAVAASEELPWEIEASRSVLETTGQHASVAGFDAAAAAVASDSMCESSRQDMAVESSVNNLVEYAAAELQKYQDADYAALYRSRIDTVLSQDKLTREVKEEVVRRLANWMMYEDIARVAYLKTHPERYTQISKECRLEPGQLIRVTEYLKPRAEEIADLLPVKLGEKVLRRVRAGKGLPFLGGGRRIPSTSAWGYWLLRTIALMKKVRRRSLRYHNEQTEIDTWLAALASCSNRSGRFVMSLATLPRLRRGYSDTLQRGVASYEKIFQSIVVPVIESGEFEENAAILQQAIDAATSDDKPEKLNETVLRFHDKASLAVNSLQPG